MNGTDDGFGDVISRMWRAIGAAGGVPDGLTTTGPRAVLPAAFDVTGLATGAVAVATLAAARHLAARGGSRLRPVAVDSRAACAAFAAEGLFAPIGWSQPQLWDPIAGNYRTADGWIRLHTNYAHHRAAALKVLGAGDRDSVEAAVAGWAGEELEATIVAAGGCAAVMHNRGEWLASAPGAATASAPPLSVAERRSPSVPGEASSGARRPFEGVRVLDLTRVIAGPVCTRFLAGHGADVLRIDPPGFEEVPALLPEMTVGKRTTALDLTAIADRVRFEALLTEADVFVSGLRADALAGLGYDDDALLALNPDLIVAHLDAYGWDGPWRDRRGFDSLVQMSCGIAADGAVAASREAPFPLPVQALDHATGWLLGAAVANALTRRLTRSETASIHASLVGTANLLYLLASPSDRSEMPTPEDFALVDTTTAWGPARHVPLPGEVDGVPAHWSRQGGPLGRDRPAWARTPCK